MKHKVLSGNFKRLSEHWNLLRRFTEWFCQFTPAFIQCKYTLSTAGTLAKRTHKKTVIQNNIQTRNSDTIGLGADPDDCSTAAK